MLTPFRLVKGWASEEGGGGITKIARNFLFILFLQRQDIYDGSELDWDGFPVEDTPTWPPDYNSWPQTATQAPPQVLPEYPPLVPTQGPLQRPYQVPPLVPTEMTVPVEPQVSPSLTVPQARPPFSTSQSQIWPSRVKPQNYMKLVVLRKMTF